MEIFIYSRTLSHPASRRRSQRTLIAALGCALLGSLSAAAQSSQSYQSSSPPYLMAASQPPLARSTFAFDPHPDPEYTLGPGDEIHISVAGREDMTFTTGIGPDGRITLPIAGTIDLRSLTRDQAAAAINTALKPYFVAPAATVSVTRYASNTVLLLGATQHPGLQSFDHQPTLMELLSRGSVGGSAEVVPTGPINTFTTRAENPSGLPEHAFIYRGANQVAEVDVRKLLSGDSFADIYLERGDVVLIPIVNDLVSILGAVKNPGGLHFVQQNTLAVLLAQAGGLDDKAGNNPLIHIVNPTTKTTQEIRYKDLFTPEGGKNITLRAGDVIFVPTSEFGKFAYVIEKLNPIMTAVAIGLAYH